MANKLSGAFSLAGQIYIWGIDSAAHLQFMEVEQSGLLI